MTNQGSATKQSFDQPGLFPPEQEDLFADQPAIHKAHTPKQQHVINSLRSLVERMEAAKTWPWRPAMVQLHRDSSFDYLCNLVSDKEEADKWRKRIAACVMRLDAAEEQQP